VSVFLNTTPTASMKIDRGAAETTDKVVTVDSAAARDVSEMRLRDRGGTWSDWRRYAARTTWTLAASDGVRAVEAQYRNATDTSAVVRDTILLDTHAPTLRLASRTVHMSMSAGALRLRLSWNDAVSRRARLLARVTQYGDLQLGRCSARVARRGRWQVVHTPWKPSAPGSYRLHLVLRDQAGHSCRVSALVVVSR
jgi:hypothetical protein